MKSAPSVEAKAEQTCLLWLLVEQVPANLSTMIIFSCSYSVYLFFNSNLWEQSDLMCRSKWCIGHRFRG